MTQGVVTRDSSGDFGQTLERVEQAIVAHDLTVFARIDHRAAAKAQGLSMHPATVLVFGNPRIGTPAMLTEPLLALDLPSRVLVWEQDGRTHVSYQDPAFVAHRFGIPPDAPAQIGALIAQALRDQALDS